MFGFVEGRKYLEMKLAVEVEVNAADVPSSCELVQ
jgi:hypothetical protein